MLVIGVGNPYRRDDAAGLIAGRRLAEEAGDAIAYREESGEPTSLIEAWQGARAVIVVDAISSGAAAGTIHRVNARVRAVPGRWFRGSTHAISVADAVELARVLGRLPPQLVIIGVEGRRFDSGVGLTPHVRRAVAQVVARGLQEIRRAGTRGG